MQVSRKKDKVRFNVLKFIVTGFPASAYLPVLLTFIIGLEYIFIPGQVPDNRVPDVLNVYWGIASVIAAAFMFAGMVSRHVLICRIFAAKLFLLNIALLLSTFGPDRPVASATSFFLAIFYAYAYILSGVVSRWSAVDPSVLKSVVAASSESQT